MIRHTSAAAALPARVVVLGATGFVGADLCRHLRSLGADVLGTSSRDLNLCAPESVGALAALLRADDALVVVSALTPDKGRDVHTLVRNVVMAEHVCAALQQTPCAHVVYVSSDAVYDDGANPVRETSCCNPSGLHGVMHLTRERMVAHTAAAKAIPLMVMRPSLLYGTADTHNGYGPNRFARLVAGGKNIPLFGDGEDKRDHVAIGDVSTLIELCLRQRSEGVLNIATGESLAFMDIARLLTRGRSSEIESLPRQAPVTHRHFDVTGTIKAFPTFRYTRVADGLAAMQAAISVG